MFKTIRFNTIQMWWPLLGLIALVIVFSWHPREFMTNADVQKKLEFHASNPKSWNMAKSKEAPLKTNQLKGPRIPVEEEKDIEAAKQKDAKDTSSTYPEVYGPEAIQVPGKSGIFQDTYTSFAEFPPGPKEPQPFLTNFSNFQK
jgi:hypothetical protein